MCIGYALHNSRRRLWEPSQKCLLITVSLQQMAVQCPEEGAPFPNLYKGTAWASSCLQNHPGCLLKFTLPDPTPYLQSQRLEQRWAELGFFFFFFFFCANAFENALLLSPQNCNTLTRPRLTFQAKSGMSSRDWKVPQLWFQLSP